jgi:hypothetical protein
MFKKIKNYFSLQRRIQIEILETLCTICLWLERDGYYNRNPYSGYMSGHFRVLKDLSKELRDKEK